MWNVNIYLYSRTFNYTENQRKKYKMTRKEIHDLHENTESSSEGDGVFSPDLYSRSSRLSDYDNICQVIFVTENCCDSKLVTNDLNDLDLDNQAKSIYVWIKILNHMFYKCNFCRKAADIILSHNKSIPMFLYLPFQAAHHPLPTPPKHYLVLSGYYWNNLQHFSLQDKYQNRKVYQDIFRVRNDDHKRAATITVNIRSIKFSSVT